jgi:aerobic carbon-monoxide dehydrogenase medium subunit
MKPAAFDYVRPATVAEALGALAGTPGAKVLAGGQTLGPMLNLRLAQPAVLVDITRIPELAAVSEDKDAVTIGATVTHAAIEDGRIPDPTGGFLARVARGIAYRAVRTRGTIGGSLAHADPSADWLACLTALRADVLIAGPRGSRRVPVQAFVRGAMETELAPEDLIVGIRIPRSSPGTRFGFHKICRKTGEFADAIGVVVADPEHDCICVVAGANTGRPLIIRARALSRGRGESRIVPSPLVGEGQGGGESQTSHLGAPPTPNPSPLFGGAPPARRGGEAAHPDWARARLVAAGFAGDDYELMLHAAALKRACDEAFAV